MLKVVCVCANGMGTSTILKLNIKSVADAEGVKLDVSSCAFGEAMLMLAVRILLQVPSGQSKFLRTMQKW